jgi:hypothetical protein
VAGGTVTGIGFGGITTGTGNGVQRRSAGGTAVVRIAKGASNLSGFFVGGGWAQVSGAFTVLGRPKLAAVRGAAGRLRPLYGRECPESWFEDFGSSQLSDGSATVPLELGFAGVDRTNAYHVFLTPQSDPKGWLYVSSKTPSGFTVYEAGGGSSDTSFDYRVVTKRKDVEGARLEHVNQPPGHGGQRAVDDRTLPVTAARPFALPM